MRMPRPIRLRGPVCRPPLLPSGSSSWVTLRNTSAAQTLQGPHPALGRLAPVPWPALPAVPALAKRLPARPRQCTHVQTLAPVRISSAHTALWATPGRTGQQAGDRRGRASAAGSVPPPGPTTAQEERVMSQGTL